MSRTSIGCTAMLASALFAALAQATPPTQVQAEGRAMLERLVAFPSVAGSEAVPEMARYLQREFVAAGFPAEDVEIVAGEGGVGLLVRYRGATGSDKAPVVFLGHMDVVPVQRDEWGSDPWTLTEKDGALYGRGVVDNKFGLLTIAHAFMRLKREGFVPDRDLVAAFSGDEESGMLTTRSLATRMEGAAYALNSDAGGGFRNPDGSGFYSYQAAEKTYASFELTVRNEGGHSSAPRPDNAIYELAAALTRLSAHRFPVKWNEVSLAALRAQADPDGDESSKAVARFVENPGDPAAVAVLEQNPYSDRELRTTCVATLLRAGTVENALASSATATVNCRIFPGETIAQTQAALVHAVANPAVEFKVLGQPVESPVSAMPAEALQALERVVAVRLPGAKVTPYQESGGTDGLHFRRAGIPTLGVGPLVMTADSKLNFHSHNERLPVAEFNEGLDHFYLMIKALAGKD